MALRTLNRREALYAATGGLLRAQDTVPVPWVCPMDSDIRSTKPDRCRKCGMQLVAGLPQPEEYPVHLALRPSPPRPGSEISLAFRIERPKGREVARLQLIHERLFHLFLLSRDLSVFRHEHPELQKDGSFLHRTVLPEGGQYRVFCDFYPEGGTPQMIAKTIFLTGSDRAPDLRPDMGVKAAENSRVSLRLEPEQPFAGKKTMLFFTIDPPDGLERYLGAWGHLLAASSDLVDVVHTHPAWEEMARDVQFNLIFPRPGLHRVWVQFQRRGVVNTAAFTVPVTEL